MTSEIPLGRMGPAEELGRTIVWLAGPDAAGVYRGDNHMWLFGGADGWRMAVIPEGEQLATAAGEAGVTAQSGR